MRTSQVNLALRLSDACSITVLSGDFVQKLQFTAGLKLSQIVEMAFPFGLQILRSQVWHCQEQSWVSDQELAVCGATYQVDFVPIQVLIEPFGFLWLDPGMTIYEVYRYTRLLFETLLWAVDCCLSPCKWSLFEWSNCPLSSCGHWGHQGTDFSSEGRLKMHS